MLERRTFLASLGLLLAALLPATAAADFVPCASGGTASCVFGPTGGTPVLIPGGLDSAYVPCSNGRFVVGATGVSSNVGLRQVANEVLGLSNYRAVPGGTTMPGSGGALLPMAVAANARNIYTLSALGSGTSFGLQLFVSAAAGTLSFGPEPRLTNIAFGGQGDLDCDPQGNVCVLAATQLFMPMTGTASFPTTVFAQWALSMSATPPLVPLGASPAMTAGGSPLLLGRPAVVFEPVGGRFWMATYNSSTDSTPSIYTIDAAPGSMPSLPFRPATVGSAPAMAPSLTQRRNALAPDGAGGVWWAWETEPGTSGASPIQLFHCATSGVTVGCRQDNSWQSASSGLHNVRLPSLAFDGRRLFFAMESHPSSSSLVGFVVLDVATNVWTTPLSGWPVDGAASPSLAADTHGNVVLHWVMTSTGAVNTATFRTGCVTTVTCPAGTTCQPVPTGSGENSCVLNPGECSMPDAGDAMADASDASDSAADSRADVPGDLADAGASDSNAADTDAGDTSASDAVAEASAADTQSAEAAMSADSAAMEASVDGATSSDSAANADSANRTLTGGSCQCAAPVGTARGRGGAAALALGALGLALARRRRR